MQIDWWTLGLQTVNFLIVIWLLSRFLYRPIRRIIEEREAADKAASDAAKDKLEEAQAVRRTYEDKTAQLAAERQEREADFHKSLEAERDKRLEAARKEKRKSNFSAARTRLRMKRDLAQRENGL